MEKPSFASALCFDSEAVAELCELTDEQGTCLVVALYEVYRQSTPALLQKIENAFGTQNREQLKAAAHSLKSSSASLGLQQMRLRCEYLEKHAAHLDFVAFADMVGELQKCFAASLAELAYFAQSQRAA